MTLTELASMLRSFRHRTMWTQEDLAHRSGVSVGTIAGIECGRVRQPRSNTLRVLADVLGLSEPERAAFTRVAELERPFPDEEEDRCLEPRPPPSLLPKAPSDARQLAPLRPMEIPRDIACFTGRLEETADLVRFFSKPVDRAMPVVAVAGAAGTGKSALAVHVAQMITERFTDGVLYVNLRGATPGREPLTVGEVLGRFLRSLGGGEAHLPADLDEASARFRSLTAGRRLLVLLDDATDAAQVQPLMPGGPTCAVLVTSRPVLAALDGARHVRLDAMSEADAVDLLAKVAGRDRVAGSMEAARRIVTLCGRLPLAVRIAGARLAMRPDWTLAGFAERLADTRGRLNELRHADLAVRSSFSVSLAGLDAKAVRMFDLFGLIEPDDITVHVVAALTDQPANKALPVLDTLVDAQLVEAREPGRYVLHDLMRLYAREESLAFTTEAERAQAIRRVHAHYLDSVRNAAGLLTPGTEPRLTAGVPADQINGSGLAFSDRDAAIGWVDAEAANLIAILRQAAGMPGSERTVIGLAAALSPLLWVRGRAADLIAINQPAAHAAQRARDPRALAQAYNDLANGYRFNRQPEEGRHYAEHALEIWHHVGCPVGEAQTLNLLANILTQLGELHDALHHYVRALDIRRGLGHRESQAAILSNIGQTYSSMGDLDKAMEVLEEALTLYREEGSTGEGMVLGNIGKVRQLRGELDQSVAALERAISLVNEAGNRRFEAEFHWYLGETLHAMGRRLEARACWQVVVRDLQSLGALNSAQARGILAEPIPPLPPVLL